MPIRDTIARAYAAADEVATDAEDDLRARTMDLLFDPTDRNDALWYDAFTSGGMDPDMFVDLTPEDLNEVDIRDRDVDWLSVQATILAAAATQARLEVVYRPLIEVAEKGALAVTGSARAMDSAGLKQAAKDGVGKSRFAHAAEERQIARRAKAETPKG